jgi:hypothetical protein
MPVGTWLNHAGPAGDGLRSELAIRTHFFNSVPDCTLGFLNEPLRASGSTSKDVPAEPFPWLSWNNRPFANAGELMLVPSFSSSQIGKTFSMSKPTGSTHSGTGLPSGDKVEQYGGPVRRATYPISGGFTQLHPEILVDGPFGHLLNFSRTKLFNDPGPNNNPGDSDDINGLGIAGLYRVLDYVGVPSRYVGTETWLSPASFGSGDPTTTDDPRYGRQPPFNRLSKYREPGRVNINTLGGDGKGAVWHGMFHDSPKYAGDPTNPDAHAAIDDDGLVSVRRGYGTFGNPDPTTLSGEPSFLNPDYPTIVGNPFRASGTGNLVPIAGMVRADVDSTLLRSMGNPPFTDSSIVPEGDPNGVPLYSTGTLEMYRDANRNPYFRYQPLTRLSGMATTRSNVYAVWVTIGFFEVEEAPSETQFASISDPSGTLTPAQLRALYNRVYPEGYQLGQEMGSDTGDFQRLRGFAIVDRTIPVAFEPGEDHNVEKAVRLRRRIE